MTTDIQQLFSTWTEAVRAKDVAARTARYAADVELFDVVGPLRHHGRRALESRLTEWFSTFVGPVDCEVRDLDIVAGEDVAFCHNLTRFSGTTANGRLDMWVRFTVGMRKVGDEWTVVHEHASVPFDPASGLASSDLRP
jgi:ketosteroid isomerase-like protein